jgi:SatD family (SatD)
VVPYVLTVDQKGSRRNPDRVGDVLRELNEAVPTLLEFERTAGDEFQGVLGASEEVVDVVLRLVRAGEWSIGVGAGPVQTPLPPSTRAGAGPAFLSARRAVDAAKQRPSRLAVRGAVPADAGDAQAVLSALAVLVDRRSEQAWEAIALVGGGRTQAEAATTLGISRQAVGQRLAAGLWDLERELRPAAARLLTRAEG